MPRETIFFNVTDDRRSEVSASAVPDTCPTCHSKIQPRQLLGVLAGTPHEGTIEAVYRCPGSKCKALFFATFTRSTAPDNYPDCFMYRGSWPWAAEKVKWSDEIEKLSPRFVEVYSSSVSATRMKLNDLVGMGLRKSLEFLVKDFAIASYPADETAIRKALLGQVIEKYCDSVKVKATARRAAWLGNDETHYERIWIGQDVEDLKVLIRLTVGWIESELLTSHYKREMPDKKGPA